MKTGKNFWIILSFFSWALFPSFVYAFNLPKAKLVRVDKPAVLLPVESYKVSYQKDLGLLSKLSLGDDEFSQEKVISLIKENNIKLDCGGKLSTKFKNNKCTELKVATYLLNKQMSLLEPEGLKSNKITSITFPMGLINGSPYVYFQFEDAVVLLFSEKNEFYVYFGMDIGTLKLLEVMSYNASGGTANRVFAIAADKNKVYLIDGTKINIIKGVDTSLVKVENPDSPFYDIVSFFHPFSNNGNLYYFFNDKLYYFKSSLSSNFDTVLNNIFKDSENVFLKGKKGEVWKLIDADPQSFTSASHHGVGGTPFDYVDNKSVFFESRDGLYKIDLSKYALVGLDNYPSIIKDKKEVMYFSKKNRKFYNIPGADAKTFEVVPDYRDVFFVDSKYVYLRNGDLSVKRLDGINRASFSLAYDTEFDDSSVILFKDKKGSYAIIEEPNDNYVIKKLPSANGSEIIYHGYGVALAKDSKNVYVSSRGQRDVLPGADPESFTIIQDNQTIYAKDYNSVYVPTGCRNYKVTKLVGADPNTFKAVGLYGSNYFGIDKNNVWYYDKKTCMPIKIKGAMPDNFNFDNYLNK